MQNETSLSEMNCDKNVGIKQELYSYKHKSIINIT